MSTRDLTFTAGETKELGSGEHFILLECDAAVTVEFYKNASPLNLYSGVLGGFKYSAPEEPIYEGGLIVGMRSMRFDSVRITSATAQTIKADVSTGDVDYLRSQGTVSISGGVTQDFPIAFSNRPKIFRGWSRTNGTGTSTKDMLIALENPAASGVKLIIKRMVLSWKHITSGIDYVQYGWADADTHLTSSMGELPLDSTNPTPVGLPYAVKGSFSTSSANFSDNDIMDFYTQAPNNVFGRDTALDLVDPTNSGNPSPIIVEEGEIFQMYGESAGWTSGDNWYSLIEWQEVDI